MTPEEVEDVVLGLWRDSPAGATFAKAAWVVQRLADQGVKRTTRAVVKIVRTDQAAQLIEQTGEVALSKASRGQLLDRMCEASENTPVSLGRALVNMHIQDADDRVKEDTRTWIIKLGNRLGLRVTRQPRGEQE